MNTHPKRSGAERAACLKVYRDTHHFPEGDNAVRLYGDDPVVRGELNEAGLIEMPRYYRKVCMDACMCMYVCVWMLHVVSRKGQGQLSLLLKDASYHCHCHCQYQHQCLEIPPVVGLT